MQAATRRKVDTGGAYLAAARRFEQLAKVFSSPSANNPPRLSARQLEASLKAFKRAPAAELAEVSALLNVIVNELDKIESRFESDEDASGRENSGVWAAGPM